MEKGREEAGSLWPQTGSMKEEWNKTGWLI
jgi:hypothetical protein